MLSSLGLLMDRMMAAKVGDVLREVGGVIEVVGRLTLLLTAVVVLLLLLSFDFGEEGFESVRLGEGKASETGEELFKEKFILLLRGVLMSFFRLFLINWGPG